VEERDNIDEFLEDLENGVPEAIEAAKILFGEDPEDDTE